MKSYLKLWGTRGSTPLSGPSHSRFGSNTSCLEIRFSDAHILIDAGTGLRAASLSLLRENILKLDLFFSHFHWDHIIGLPYFEHLYHPEAEITFWTPEKSLSSNELLDTFFTSPFFPVNRKKILAKLHHKTTRPLSPVRLGSISLDFHPTIHPGITYAFKIQTPHKTIGYATDSEALPGFHGAYSDIAPHLFKPHQSLIDFFKPCHLLIHEAQYFPDQYPKKMGWGHSSVLNAAALVAQTQVPAWAVVHHDPDHTDSDLLRLQHLAREVLEQGGIRCRADWLPDGHIIE